MSKTQHSKHSSFHLQILVLVLLLAGFVGFYYSNQKKNSPAPVQTTVDTTNWKTYTTNKLGYDGSQMGVTLQYPGLWKEPETNSSSGGMGIRFNLGFDPANEKGVRFEIDKARNDNPHLGRKILFSEYLANTERYAKTKAQNIDIQDLIGKKIVSSNRENIIFVRVLVAKKMSDTDYLDIVYSYENTQEGKQTVNLIDQVITTIRIP